MGDLSQLKKRDMRKLLGHRDMFLILIIVIISTPFYPSPNPQQPLHLFHECNHMSNFTMLYALNMHSLFVCQLYFNKVLKNQHGISQFFSDLICYFLWNDLIHVLGYFKEFLAFEVAVSKTAVNIHVYTLHSFLQL